MYSYFYTDIVLAIAVGGFALVAYFRHRPSTQFLKMLCATAIIAIGRFFVVPMTELGDADMKLMSWLYRFGLWLLCVQAVFSYSARFRRIQALKDDDQ